MAALLLVHGLVGNGTPDDGIGEVLALATRLCQQQQRQLAVLLTGQMVGECAQQAIACGAPEVLVAEGAALRHYDPEVHVQVLEDLCSERRPDVILMSHDATSMDLAPRLAVRLGGRAILDCEDLAPDGDTGRLLVLKPVFGGALIAELVSSASPLVATIRRNVVRRASPDAARAGMVSARDVAAGTRPRGIRFLRSIDDDAGAGKIEDAEFVICAGRGLPRREHLEMIEELGAALGGEIAGTRPICERGWLDRRRQVGLTGARIAPKVYLGVGVSGAAQHMAGLVGAQTIMAINKDRAAAIFGHADYGVVADVTELLPALLECARAARMTAE